MVFRSSKDHYYQKLKELHPHFSNYSMAVKEQGVSQCVINSYEKGNISRFINHACDEKVNLMPEIVRVHHTIPRIALVTTRAI
jgi:SET domain-containing protein